MPERAYLYRVNAGSRRIRTTAEDAKRKVNSQRGFSTLRALATIAIPAATAAGTVALVQQEVLPNVSAEIRENDWHGLVKPALYGAIPGVAIDLMLLALWASSGKKHSENYIETLFGRYGLIQKVGRGGFGVVYKARDLETGDLVAVKKCQFMADDPGTQYAQGILEREAKGLRLLGLEPTHPSIVRFVDYQSKITPQGIQAVLVTEFVEGVDLKERMDQCGGRLSITEALTVGAYVARGLRYAYEKQLEVPNPRTKEVRVEVLHAIHRDIKPENIRLRRGATGQGQVVILDWGLVKGFGAGKVTEFGDIVGSRHYMSPEQIKGSPNIDFRTDIYSLGATLYEAIAGTTPYQLRGPADLAQVVDEKTLPVDIRKYRPEVPEPIAQLINKMMAKKPEDRYQSHDALDGDLRDGIGIAVTENL